MVWYKRKPNTGKIPRITESRVSARSDFRHADPFAVSAIVEHSVVYIKLRVRGPIRLFGTEPNTNNVAYDYAEFAKARFPRKGPDQRLSA